MKNIEMPQFDTNILLSEIFWLFISFIIIYCSISLYLKYSLFRIFYIRKYWLNFFINFSLDLKKKIWQSIEAYSDDIYFYFIFCNFLQSDTELIFINVHLDENTNHLDENTNYNFFSRKSFHNFLTKFFQF